MREILFRGQCCTDGKWVEGYLGIEVPDELVIQQFSFDEYFKSDCIDQYSVKPETIGQYTGLTDKNAKKIFEHDILKAYDPLDKRYFIGVVKYFDASFYICDTNSVPCYFGEYSFTDFEVEVIGNIYDDPELMEGERL